MLQVSTYRAQNEDDFQSVKVIPQARALNNDRFCLDRVNYLGLVFLLVSSYFIEKDSLTLEILVTLTGKYLRALTFLAEKKKNGLENRCQIKFLTADLNSFLIYVFPSAVDIGFAKVILQKGLFFFQSIWSSCCNFGVSFQLGRHNFLSYKIQEYNSVRRIIGLASVNCRIMRD